MLGRQKQDQGGEGAWLLYDGECPFCSRYVKLVRFREAVGRVRLIDARQDSALLAEIAAANLNLDEGMVLKLNGRYYHGAECIHTLALLSTPSTMFNRLNIAIFRAPTLARLLYPLLRAGRNTVLRLLGRSKINVTAT